MEKSQDKDITDLNYNPTRAATCRTRGMELAFSKPLLAQQAVHSWITNPMGKKLSSPSITISTREAVEQAAKTDMANKCPLTLMITSHTRVSTRRTNLMVRASTKRKEQLLIVTLVVSNQASLPYTRTNSECWWVLVQEQTHRNQQYRLSPIFHRNKLLRLLSSTSLRHKISSILLFKLVFKVQSSWILINRLSKK